MSLTAQLKALQEFDLADLDFENYGSWPPAVKIIALVALISLITTAGFYFHIDNLYAGLGAVRQDEQALRREYEQKAFKAANLDAYKAQLAEMAERFGALVAQLPSETEVPGLLDDITNKGELNGLSIKRIDLLDEQSHAFYLELPIALEAGGSYHDLGAFISGLAGLPRIVTLHDFELVLDDAGPLQLHMRIDAKTYRYREEFDEV
ncbi:MAG: type 4a pilus biogenesis protein PilO [Halieaceae bacterium]